MLNDLSFSLRQLRRSPVFSLLSVLTLALGIGANTAIFSVINDLLLRDLPYRNPDRLVMVWEQNLQRGDGLNKSSLADFLDWRRQSKLFDELASFTDRTYTLTGTGTAEDVKVTAVSANFFSLLGADALLGRVFSSEDERDGSPPVTLLSYNYWKVKFGGDPAVIGRTIIFNDTPVTVIGVLPESFRFYVKEGARHDGPAAVWDLRKLSHNTSHGLQRNSRSESVIGSLKPGVTLAQARTEMETISAGLADQFPESNKGWSVNLVPLHRQITGEIRPALLAIFGAVGLILLIACANVASLQLVRTTVRQREITMRTVLGASRARIVRLLLAENLLLAVAAATTGLLFARWGIAALHALMPSNLAPVEQVGLDPRVLGFSVAVALASGVLFGLVPAFATASPRLSEAMNSTAHGMNPARGRRLRASFVVAQVALTSMVLIGAGLLTRSFSSLLSTDLGFNTRNLLTARIALPYVNYDDPTKVQAFYRQAIERVRALPGVRSVSGNVFAPFSGPGDTTPLTLPGLPKAATAEQPVADMRIVAPDYFSTLGIPLLQGRDFTAQEQQEARGVVIINETLARKYFPGRSPVGQRLLVSISGQSGSEIVGVVGDTRQERLDQPARAMVYCPHSELPFPIMTLLVRTETAPLALAPAVQRAVAELDPNLPVSNLNTMDSLVAATFVRARFTTLLFSLFGALALFLATIGIYGVVSYTVAQQTREIGIRMALGADSRLIVTDVLHYGAILVAVGAMLGLLGAFGLARFLSSQLYGISALDPITFGAVPLALLLVALCACWLPARRAARVDPLVALRSE